MGAVEVLRPQDPLQSRLNSRDANFVKSAMKSKKNCKPNPNPNPNRGGGVGRSDRRKRGGVGSPEKKKVDLVMGQVKILKRGEVLSETTPLKEKVEKKSVSGRPGSGPDLFAGPVCVSSPPPSSLPVPAFFKKKAEDNNDFATCDLIRLLRLDLS